MCSSSSRTGVHACASCAASAAASCRARATSSSATSAGRPASSPTLRYQLPQDDLDALISVSSDDDVDNLMDELDRVHGLAASAIKPPRLRLFLFASSPPDHSSAGAFGSVLSGTGDVTSEQLFVDSINAPAPGSIDRGRSEASSIVSENPSNLDYLLGFDPTSDEPSPRMDPRPKSDMEMAHGEDYALAPRPRTPPFPYVAESAPWPAPPPPYMGQPVYYFPVRPVHYLEAAGQGGGYMPGPVYHIVGGGGNEGPGDLYAPGSVGGVYGLPHSVQPFRPIMYAPPRPSADVYPAEGKPPEGGSNAS